MKIDGGCQPGTTPAVHADVRTTRLIAYLYRVRDRMKTVMDVDGRRTLSSHFWEFENGSRRSRVDRYDDGKVITVWEPGSAEPRTVHTPAPPGTLDPFTVLMLLRGAPLKDGDRHHVPVFSKDSVYVGTVRVLGREDVELLGRPVRAIHLRATFEKGGKQSSVYADIWLTDDARRLPARVEAGTRFGRLKSELVEVERPPGGA